MAVPDWPTSYGYNMFLFPISQWVGGIFYEHTHRLVASGVGLLTAILAVWCWLRESRAWVRRLGVVAFFLVVLQGVLGGLRVTLLKDQIGIFHATLAQLFFVLLCSLAFVTSARWHRLSSLALRPGLRTSLLAATLLILLQLTLGATMRHQHAGLAVPDFPSAYGSLWPKTDRQSVAAINQRRSDVRDFRPVTAFQIRLHMIHRLTAVGILALVGWPAFLIRRELGSRSPLGIWSSIWFGLIVVQAALGASTVWSNKAADVATAHVVLGAMSLAFGGLLTVAAFQSASRAGQTLTKLDRKENFQPAFSPPDGVVTAQ